jgi:hypothetical protein
MVPFDRLRVKWLTMSGFSDIFRDNYDHPERVEG